MTIFLKELYVNYFFFLEKKGLSDDIYRVNENDFTSIPGQLKPPNSLPSYVRILGK